MNDVFSLALMQKTKNIDVNQGASQFPGFEDYTMKGRTYHYMTETPLFQFGYGLSYTTFSIGTANISSTQIKNAESVKLNIPVPHTGKRKGTEIVQVYVRKVNDTDGPTKTLLGFQRMEVAAGKTNQAVTTLPYNAFEFFDTTTGSMEVTSGEYEIFYGNSSDAKDLKTTKVSVLLKTIGNKRDLFYYSLPIGFCFGINDINNKELR